MSAPFRSGDRSGPPGPPGPRAARREVFDKLPGRGADDKVLAAFRSWGVVESYLALGKDVGRTAGKVFMVRLADGLWRRAEFKGQGGPAWAVLETETYDAPSGKAAYLAVLVDRAAEHRRRAEVALREQSEVCAGLAAELAAELARAGAGAGGTTAERGGAPPHRRPA
jgi:hypothetical protein